MSEEIVDIVKQPPRFRTQTGRLVRYASGWHVRYYDTDENGEHKRVKAWLAWPDTDMFEAEKLMAAYIKKINERRKNVRVIPPPDEFTVGRFWVTTHLPMLENGGKHSWSTIRSYKQIWKDYLKPHFENRPLRGYSTRDANQWLTDLVTGKTTKTGKRLNASSYGLVRSVASGIFTHALNDARNLLPEGSTNPFRNVKLFVRIDKWVQGKAYSQEEIVKVLGAFEPDELGPKLFFAIGAMQGLRPSEIAGLKFEDLDLKAGTLSVRRSCPYGHAQETTKTERSQRTITLSKVVVPIYKAWLKERGDEAKPHRYVFSRRAGQPVDTADFDFRFIRPVAQRAGVDWHGMKACRRTAATEQTMLTKNTESAHHNIGDTREMTDRHYALPIPDLGRRGQLKYDAAIEKRLKKS